LNIISNTVKMSDRTYPERTYVFCSKATPDKIIFSYLMRAVLLQRLVNAIKESIEKTIATGEISFVGDIVLINGCDTTDATDTTDVADVADNTDAINLQEETGCDNRNCPCVIRSNLSIQIMNEVCDICADKYVLSMRRHLQGVYSLLKVTNDTVHRKMTEMLDERHAAAIEQRHAAAIEQRHATAIEQRHHNTQYGIGRFVLNNDVD
jgi:hypothetical protein